MEDSNVAESVECNETRPNEDASGDKNLENDLEKLEVEDKPKQNNCAVENEISSLCISEEKKLDSTNISNIENKEQIIDKDKLEGCEIRCDESKVVINDEKATNSSRAGVDHEKYVINHDLAEGVLEMEEKAVHQTKEAVLQIPEEDVQQIQKVAVPQTQEEAVLQTQEKAVHQTKEAVLQIPEEDVQQIQKVAVPQTQEEAVLQTQEEAVLQTQEEAVLQTQERAVQQTQEVLEVNVEENSEDNQWYTDEEEEEEEDRTEGSRYGDEEEGTEDEVEPRKRRDASDQSEEEDELNTDEDELSDGELQEATDSEEQIEGKRFSGDGQEEPKADVEKEDDRKNPAYVPRKGTYFEHDLRAQVDENEDDDPDKKEKSKKKSRADDNKWEHDKFDAFEQAPKRTQEIVRRYGYDIRRDGNHSEDKEHDAKSTEEGNRKEQTNVSGPRYKKQAVKPRDDMGERRPPSPRNHPQRGHPQNRRRGEDGRDFRERETRGPRGRPVDHRRNHQPARRGYRTEIITTRGTASDKDKEFLDTNETEFESQSKTEKMVERRTPPKEWEEHHRSNVDQQKHTRSRNEGVSEGYNRNYGAQRYTREEGHRWGRERDYNQRRPERKGYSHYRHQDQLQQQQQQEHRQPFRDSLNRRPPRMMRHHVERPPKDLEIVNSSIIKGRNKIMDDHDDDDDGDGGALRNDQVDENRSNKTIENTKQESTKESSSSAKSGSKVPEISETRKGWAGGEFTPSWRTDPQHRSGGGEEEANVVRASKRYSSSRQQQKHQQFQDVDYYQHHHQQQQQQQHPQYPQYTSNSTPVYDATMMPHPAYMPHSTLVTNSYAPFYSTLPGSVYPNPPVYQHPQLTHYTNSSYMQHVAQAPEGHVFYGHQGVPQGQYFDPQQTSVSQMRATSAIPIVNPQDLSGGQKGVHPEAVTVRSQ